MARNTSRDNNMVWTTDMRIGLLTLIVLSGSPLRWDVVRDIWFDEFSAHAPGYTKNKRLKGALSAQYHERTRVRGQTINQWSPVGETLEQLASQAPELVGRLQAAYTARTGGVPLPQQAPHRLQQETSRSHLGSLDVRQWDPSTGSWHAISAQQAARTQQRSGITSSTRSGGSTRPQQLSNPGDQPRSTRSSATHQEVPTPSTNPVPRRNPGQSTEEYLLQRRTMDHGPLREIPQQVAHPPLPVLFYRYYDTAATHVGNYPNGRGFIAAHYNGQPIHQGFSNPPDATSDILFEAIEIHVNMRTFPPSRFVSVTSNLHWVMTAAALKHAQGRDMRISIIDARAAAGDDGKRAYHYEAYYDQLRERAAFDDCAKMMYKGRYEYLIWAHIPSSAVVADFGYTDLKAMSENDQDLHALLRLNQLEVRGQGGSDKIRERWKQRPIDLLDPSTIELMVELIIWFFCRNPATKVTLSDALTKLVSDLTCGWIIRPSRRLNRKEWAEVAIHFSRTLHTRLEIAISHKSLYHLAKAFLFGIISGLGEPNWYLNPAQRADLLKRMAEYGLEQPDVMLRESDNVMVASVRSLMRAPPTPQQTTTPQRPAPKANPYIPVTPRTDDSSYTSPPVYTPLTPSRPSHGTNEYNMSPLRSRGRYPPSGPEDPVHMRSPRFAAPPMYRRAQVEEESAWPHPRMQPNRYAYNRDIEDYDMVDEMEGW